MSDEAVAVAPKPKKAKRVIPVNPVIQLASQIDKLVRGSGLGDDQVKAAVGLVNGLSYDPPVGPRPAA